VIDTWTYKSARTVSDNEMRLDCGGVILMIIPVPIRLHFMQLGYVRSVIFHRINLIGK